MVSPGADRWIFRLYVAGCSVKSIDAYRNLREICRERLRGRYRIQVIDVLARPGIARALELFALPALVCTSRGSRRRLIGNLSNTGRVLRALDLA